MNGRHQGKPSALPLRAARAAICAVALGWVLVPINTTAAYAGPAKNKLTGIRASSVNASAVTCNVVVEIDHEAVRGHRGKWLTIQERVNFGSWVVVNTIQPSPKGTGTFVVTMHGRTAGAFYEYRSTLFGQKGKSAPVQLDQTAASDAVMCS